MLQSLIFCDLDGARALLSGGRGLRSGDGGATVQAIQFALDALGYSLPVSVCVSPLSADGQFGAETAAAVVAFQRENSLVADGIVGRFTIVALDAALQNSRADPLENALGKFRAAIQQAGERAIQGETSYSSRDVGRALGDVDALALGNPLRVRLRMNRLARTPGY